MARTGLLRSLARLAREFHSAEAQGIPLEVVREARARENEARTFTRREVLAGMAAVAATLALPTFARGAGGPRIAIVGGGIAGLVTALKLADAGVAATVYESSGRIGGRIHTERSGYWNQGQITEWCGQAIDSNHKTMIHLADRFNLALTDLKAGRPPGATDTYYFLGQYYTIDEVEQDFRPVFRALRDDLHAAGYPTLYNSYTPAGAALDAMSLYEWIETRVPGGHNSRMGNLLDVAYVAEYGDDSRKQSALNIVFLLGFGSTPRNFNIYGPSDEHYHITGGNDQLVNRIAAHLGVGDAVLTGWRMTSLRRRSDGRYALAFDLQGGGARSVVADIVVLALPFAVLRHLDYQQAGFDDLKTTAIEQLGRAKAGKIFLQFTSRLWNSPGPWPGISSGQTIADTGYQFSDDVTIGQTGSNGILMDYTAGSVNEAMTPQVPYAFIPAPGVFTDAQRFLNQIRPVLPGLDPLWNGKAASSLPRLDPNLRLAYSYYRVGQYTRFAGYEPVRQQNVFFAGEHTSYEMQGFMEGGASSGKRVANEILTDLNKV
jgi:monoamine oxidase